MNDNGSAVGSDDPLVAVLDVINAYREYELLVHGDKPGGSEAHLGLRQLGHEQVHLEIYIKKLPVNRSFGKLTD